MVSSFYVKLLIGRKKDKRVGKLKHIVKLMLYSLRIELNCHYFLYLFIYLFFFFI